MTRKKEVFFEKVFLWFFVISVCFIPLNGFVGLVLATVFHNNLWKIIASTAVLASAALLIVYIAYVHRNMARKIFTKGYNIVALVYLLIVTMYALPLSQGVSPSVYGWMIDARFVFVFFAAQFAALILKRQPREKLLRVIFSIGIFIAGIAIIEALVPRFVDFLHSMGYWVTDLDVDANHGFGRASGTLRGPNELGAYLAALFFLGLYLIKSAKKAKNYLVLGEFVILIGLYFSYSRSAYLGTIVGLCIIGLGYLYRHRVKVYHFVQRRAVWFVAIVCVLTLAGVSVGVGLRASNEHRGVKDYLSIVLLHADPNGAKGPKSDDQRLKYWDIAWQSIKTHPMGQGIGSSGLASLYRGPNRGNITESYYLQLFEEIGVIGCMIFLVFLLLVFLALLRQNVYIAGALAAVAVATAFLHTMDDEAVSITLWFLAGLVIAGREDKVGMKQWIFKLKQGTEEENYGRQTIVNVAKQHFDSSRLQKGMVVDLGAGYGTDLLNVMEALPKGVKYSAVENWEPYRKILREKDIKSYSLDIERDKLPFKDGTVDIVIANQIIEHTKEIFWIFNEIHRVLKPGGVAIIGVPNIASFHNRVAMLFGMQPTSIELYSAHVRGITAGSFRRFIEKNGFYELAAAKGANFYPFPPAVSRMLARLFPKASVGLTLVCKKTQKKGAFLSILNETNFETPFYTGVIPKK